MVRFLSPSVHSQQLITRQIPSMLLIYCEVRIISNYKSPPVTPESLGGGRGGTHDRCSPNARTTLILNLPYSDHLKVIGFSVVRLAGNAQWPKGRFMNQICSMEQMNVIFTVRLLFQLLTQAAIYMYMRCIFARIHFSNFILFMLLINGQRWTAVREVLAIMGMTVVFVCRCVRVHVCHCVRVCV